MSTRSIDVDKEELEEMNEQISKVMSSDAFLEQLRIVVDADKDERLDVAMEHLTPEAMKKAGVDLPKGTRISSRYFEGSDVQPVELGEIRNRPNLMTEMHKVNPTIFGDLRRRDPKLINELIQTAQPIGGPSGEDFVTVCASAGLGGTVCVSVGGDV